MNIRDLIARLEEIAEDHPEATILLATQPSWPLQSEVAGVATTAEIADESQCDEHGFYHCDECAPKDEDVVVYIVEGGQPDESPYAPRAAWEVATA